VITSDRDDTWGAHLAPDQRTVYVTGSTNIWSFSLTPWLPSGPTGSRSVAP
jgi:hypothetical protein